MLDLVALTFLQVIPAHVARAEIFYSDEGAAHLMFPSLILTPKTITLTDAQAKTIEKLSDQDVHDKNVKIFTAKSGELVVIDRVLGKHEFITYAVGLTPNHQVKQIEILEYRETYGNAVERPEWRKQFYGKDKTNELKLTKDIQNVSGATLSCKHVTDGVRRVLQMVDVIHAEI
jgi:Na+-translocating ferredoxin:NAD+ oxidoreductase RnfG subunit